MLKNRFRLAVQLLGLACLVAGFAWALYVYGATETRELFRFLLMLLVPLLLLLAGVWKDARSPNLWLLLWGAFLLFQVGFSPTLQARGYSLFAVGWVALCLARGLTPTDQTRRWLLFSLIAVGIIEGLVGFTQVIHPHGGSQPASRIATGTLYNQNHFAGLENMLFGLALGALFALYSRGSRWGQPGSERLAQTWIAVLACSLVGIPVFLSRSRAGAMILVLCVISAYGLQRFGQSGGEQRRRGAVPLVLVLAVTLGLGSILGLDTLVRRFESSQSSLQSRLVVYRDTLDLISDNPLLGIGPMNFEWRFRPYQTVAGRVWYDYAHNDYLQIVAEWGLPLGLALWAFVFWRLLRSVRVFLDDGDPWRRGIALGCSLAIFSLLLHSLVDFNLYIPVNQAVFCAILGLSWSLDLEGRATAPALKA